MKLLPRLIRFACLVALAVSNFDGLGAAQAPTLRTQGYAGGCDSVTVFWFTQTPQSQISHFNLNTFAGGFTVANDKRSFKIPCACSSGGQVIVTEVRFNGSTVSAQYSGNLPHNRPCDQCGNVGGAVGIANAASWRDGETANSIAVLGSDSDLISGSAQASTIPLPLSLLGLSVEIAGQPAGLFFVSPRQINFWIPRDVPQGIVPVSVLTPDGRLFRGTANIQPEAPAIFTESGNGQGFAKATWWDDGITLSLWGTAFKSPWVTLYLGDGRRVDATYSGEAPGYYGLWQLNFPMARPAVPISGWVRSWVSACRCDGYRDSQPFDLR